ncbi:HEAT repeat domain-containing protein [Paenibacillus filicis]|uniref:HEAT repeat domain-containing protein n=1 Tax=Paenibacillus filicis TaxID=669464 RepID=A0ABU9DQK9_9BACL
MSTALLQELHQEVRRVYIAGSDLAEEDFRLKRLLPQFQQLGERSPVFKRLSEMIAALITPEAPEHERLSTAETLQELASLLNSVLYTQGATAPTGELTPVRHQPTAMPTQASYRQLAAVREALTTTGGGRYEIVHEAAGQGLFHDLRMVRLAIRALGDPYAELADFMALKVLPTLSAEIIPSLLESFNPDGGRADARKLQVVAVIDKAAHLEWIARAARAGSDEVRVTAIEWLSGEKAYEPELIEWTKDKKKSIRQAAYLTLSSLDTEAVRNRLYEGLTGKDADIASEGVRMSESPVLMDRVTEELNARILDLIHKQPDAKNTETLVEKILLLTAVLSGKQSDRLLQVYMEALRDPIFLTGPVLSVSHVAADYLADFGGERGLELLTELEKKNPFFYPFALRTGYRCLTPAAFYDRYGAPLERMDGANKERRQEVRQILDLMKEQLTEQIYETIPAPWYEEGTMRIGRVQFASMSEVREKWDARWLNWLIAYSETQLVSIFAVPGHSQAELYLRGKLENNPEHRNRFAGKVLLGLERTGVPDLHELLMLSLEHERNQSFHHFDHHVWEMMLQMPSSYGNRLEAILPKFTHSARKQTEYLVERLKNTQ